MNTGREPQIGGDSPITGREPALHRDDCEICRVKKSYSWIRLSPQAPKHWICEDCYMKYNFQGHKYPISDLLKLWNETEFIPREE